MKKFWNWIRDDSGGRVLRLEGPIDSESIWGDEVTPQAFRQELESDGGDITVYINSPGGNVFAAAEIYTMLREYKGKVTVKIASVAASAASVVAMAGNPLLMSPTAMLFLHDPSTMAMGNAKDMQRAIDTLNAVKESIIAAYREKSGLSHNRISMLMSNESWLTAQECVDYGFADGILPRNDGCEALIPEKTEGENSDDKEVKASWQAFSNKAMGQRVLNWLMPTEGDGEETPADSAEETAEQIETGVTEEELPAYPSETQSEETAAQAEPEKEEVPPMEDTTPKAPVIGMDGRAADGSMPYLLLKRQLDFLK